MRLSPAQLAVHQICGYELPFCGDLSVRQRLISGRASLCSITGENFGFDLQKWHDHLKESRKGGYTWNRSIDLPKIMKRAMEDEQWVRTVKAIETNERRAAEKP